MARPLLRGCILWLSSYPEHIIGQMQKNIVAFRQTINRIDPVNLIQLQIALTLNAIINDQVEIKLVCENLEHVLDTGVVQVNVDGGLTLFLSE